MEQDIIDLPLQGRAASVQSIDAESRTVEVVWTTGAQVRRYSFARDEEFDEELVVSPNAMRLERLNSGAPFLESHRQGSLSAILGVVVEGSVRLEGGKGYARIRFSEREQVQPIWDDIRSGIIRHVSVGYKVHRFERVAKADRSDSGVRALYRAVDWEPMEISAVAIGADPGAGIRDADTRSNPCTVTRRGASQTEEATMADETNTAAGGNAEAVRVAPAAPVVDVEQVRAQERERVATISRLVRRHNLGDTLEQRLIADGTDLDAARSAILDELARTDNAGPTREVAVEVRVDETQTRMERMQDALFCRIAGSTAEVPAHAREFMDMSLVEMAAFRLNERRIPGSFGAREEILRRALHSTSDFPAIFENAINRNLAARYQSAPLTYRSIARQRTYQDFRDHTTVRVGDMPRLQQVNPDGGELLAGTFSEAKERTRALAYGVRFGISRAMMVNDNLSALVQVLNDQGDAVAHEEEARFYEMMLGGANADGPTLLETTRQVFNTTDTTKAGTAAAVTVTSVGLGKAAMAKRTSLDGRKLRVMPAVLLVGPDKWLEAAQVIAPIQAQQSSNVNPLTGAMEVISTAYIEGNAWYMFAAPSALPCFEWGLLDGYSAPRMRMEEIFGVQGTQISLEHDFGCGAIDFRGGYKNAGA